MKTVFFVKPGQKKELEQFIESTKYEPESLARKGYTIVEGKSISKPEGLYLIIESDNLYKEKLKSLIKNFAEEIEADEIVKAVEENQKRAEEGFGAIFG